jgi:glycosyltransferase involved in cell wall biosynthesis
MEIVTLSIGRNILKVGSRDRLRMALYARYTDAFHIIVLSRRTHGYHEDVHEGDLHVYPTNSTSRVTMLVDAFRIAYRILKKKKGYPRTITAQDPIELGLLSYFLSMLTKVPYTVQIHGDYYSDAWAEGSITRRLRRRVIPFVLWHAAKVRVVSERIKKSLLRLGVSEETVYVLPIRPELDVFLKAGEHKELPLAFTVLTASRLASEKNIPLLICAFSKLHALYPDTRLRIVGEGDERLRIESCVKDCGLEGAVTMLPWDAHIEHEMANAHVFALASLHEAYGLVLIEALATGTPVVTTDVGCANEVVRDGEHGLVVPVNDEEALAHALIRMYEQGEFRVHAGMHGRLLGQTLSRVSEDTYAKEWVAHHSA